MSLFEKLQMMEALWEDLSRNSEPLESPAWHETVLREREKRRESGEMKFIDWEKAKEEIRARVA